jgi:hypothetical protein
MGHISFWLVLMGDNTDTLNKNTETLTKYMLQSQQNASQNHSHKNSKQIV